MKICFSEENDVNFIRWAANLLLPFFREGSITAVRQTESPDAMIASIWRKHEFRSGLPVILVTNENWKLFPPHAPLHKYAAVVGIYPPKERCHFIRFPYAAVHFDVAVEDLYRVRKEFLNDRPSRFCCFVTSGMLGEFAEERMALFRRINSWKRVHSAGKVLNNVQYLAPHGLDFLRWISRFRFMICLENSKETGYITEKPFQPWFAGSVPIYDGGCVDELNPDAILNVSAGDVLEQLEALESQPALYGARRHAELSAVPLSLEPFKRDFKKRMVEIGLMRD